MLWAFKAHNKALEESDKAAWNHTATLLCQQAEIHRDRKKRRKEFKPIEFHPYYRQKKEPKKIMVGIKALKYLFVDRDMNKFNQEVNKAILKEEKERNASRQGH